MMKKRVNKPKVRTCKHCGCSERNACVGGPFGTCAWVSPNECSGCRPGLLKKRLAASRRRAPSTTAGKNRKKKMNQNDNEAGAVTQAMASEYPVTMAEVAPAASETPEGGSAPQESLDVPGDSPEAPSAPET